MNKSLLVAPQSQDARSIAIENLTARLEGIDLKPIVVHAIDNVASENLPFLAQHLHLTGALWDCFPNDNVKRQALKEAFLWHYRKGTPWAIKTALKWLGFDVAIFEDRFDNENRWTEYELEFGDDFQPTPEIVKKIKDLAEYAAPARAHLKRLFHAYNRRILIASAGKKGGHAFSGTALLSDDSGVFVDDIKVSLGKTHKFFAENGENFGLSTMLTRHLVATAQFHRGLSWAFYLDTDKTPLEAKVSVAGTYTAVFCSQSLLDSFAESYTWQSEQENDNVWDNRLWRGNVHLAVLQENTQTLDFGIATQNAILRQNVATATLEPAAAKHFSTVND